VGQSSLHLRYLAIYELTLEVTGPPEAVTPDATDALARCLVAGVLATVPGGSPPE
jgi:hypothetical protein